VGIVKNRDKVGHEVTEVNKMAKAKKSVSVRKGGATPEPKLQETIKVLFVDDEPDVLGLSKVVLKIREGLNVDNVRSAEEALKKLEGGGYDAVVADSKIPVIDGIEFLKTLRNRGDEIPFIMFTRKSRDEIALEAFSAGADRYFQKGGAPTLQLSMLAREIRDVVDKKRISRKLAREQRLLRTLMENSPDQIYFKDCEHRFIMLNKATAKNLGTTVENAIGKTDFDFFPRRSAKEYHEDEEAILKGSVPLINKVEKTGHQGDERWNYSIKAPMFNEAGEIRGIMGINRDFTERKKAEEKKEFLHSILSRDMRNKIQTLRGYLELLRGTELSGEQKKIVKKIQNVIAGCADLIDKIEKLEHVEKTVK
jgi:PAS domain S-box-containing protein